MVGASSVAVVLSWPSVVVEVAVAVVPSWCLSEVFSWVWNLQCIIPNFLWTGVDGAIFSHYNLANHTHLAGMRV